LHKYGRPYERIEVFPNWVDTNIIRPVDASELRRSLGLSAEDIVLLYAGSLGEKQGVETLVLVLEKLAEIPGAKCVVVGDGPYRKKISELCTDRSDTIFLPTVSEERLTELLSLADIHLLPQRAGVTSFAFPSKLAPMLASGRPVIAQVDSGCTMREILARCGIATSPGDAHEFVHAIRCLVADRKLRTALGAAARVEAEARFERNRVLQLAWGAIFSDSLDAARRRGRATSADRRRGVST